MSSLLNQNITNLQDLLEKVNNLQTLSALGDAAAKPSDIAYGKVLYDDEGNPVTGTLIEADEIQEKLFATSDYSFGGTTGGSTFNVSGVYNANLDGVVVRPGAGLGVRKAPTDFFGNATADQVAKGATFTSAAGLLVEGTHECEGGVTLPELGDTAAQPSDIAYGKILYDDDGNPVTGTVDTVSNIVVPADITSVQYSGSSIFATGIRKFRTLINSGGTIRMDVSADKFGDAQQSQVLEGTTFTSSNGLCLPGTMKATGGVELPELGDTAAQPTDMVAGKVLYDDDGNPVTGTLYENIDSRVFSFGNVNDELFLSSAGNTNIALQGVYYPSKIGDNTVGTILRPGALVAIRDISTEKFGDATADQVTKGATFTSAAGLLVEGTKEINTETWTLTLEDGSTVEKVVHIG